MKRENIFSGESPQVAKGKSKMITINATIYLRHKDEEYKKVYDALKVIELMFKDKIEIKIKLTRLRACCQKTKEPNLFVLFHHKAILKNCYKLDSYIYIVKMILDKKQGD